MLLFAMPHSIAVLLFWKSMNTKHLEDINVDSLIKGFVEVDLANPSSSGGLEGDGERNMVLRSEYFS